MKKGVFGVLMMAGGLLMGAGAGYLIGYRRANAELSESYAKMADEEITAIKKQCEAVCEIHRQSYKAAETKMNDLREALTKGSDDPVTKELDDTVKKFNQDVNDGVKRVDAMVADTVADKPADPANKTDYTKYSKKNKQKGDLSYADDKVETDENGIKTIKPKAPEEQERIELITQQQYESDTTYDQVELTYWRGNSCLVDGMGYECSIEETIGWDALDHFGDEVEAELFVRNNHDEISYHVYLEYGMFNRK